MASVRISHQELPSASSKSSRGYNTCPPVEPSGSSSNYMYQGTNVGELEEVNGDSQAQP